MKAEILASYTSHAEPPRAQSLLPQSLRKPRALLKRINPTKLRRGRPRKLEAAARKQDPHSNFTQSNFVSRDPFRAADAATDSDGDDTLDPDFLSALPEDMRQEIIEEHRRKRLAKKGGLGLVASNASKKRKPPEAPPLGQRRIRLPPRERKPTFTTQELSTLPELRETLSAWHQEFAADGPHPEDVAAMERYLRRVVLDERDVGKVVGVVKWISWLLDESPDDDDGKRAWEKALEGIKEEVQDAIKERGIGRVEL
jgi:DNA repair protein REV1